MAAAWLARRPWISLSRASTASNAALFEAARVWTLAPQAAGVIQRPGRVGSGSARRPKSQARARKASTSASAIGLAQAASGALAPAFWAAAAWHSP